jgi:putative hydrolase of HD superfamily
VVQSLPGEVSTAMTELFMEMNAQETKEAKLYKALDKLEALIQHNESPISTWSENEYGLNMTYAFENVQYSDWLLALRKEILNDTLRKIEAESGDS